ncbi:NADP-dependent oxidoreductase [Flavobacterium sedimenticola]|uniref:NADP-dependent oxidoreductase n=1 Tax=Flavobacterium sedimenticola TaxID=3043286 RepID=A0ABT6XRC8_9FLAO|nr:NADP-dependent oxidoreductase [Flavobacterium sedimenticola]MDI9257550.1 NADP-dependent oxidoreductase [Flavobacterium sedimenticola]
MKAYVLKEAGTAENLQLVELEKPNIKNDEVLIKVKALSINPVDIKTRIGKSLYQQLSEDRPIILGWDVSGIVEAIGSDVTNFNVGDAVFGMVNFPGHGKGYAEYVAAPAVHLAEKPNAVSHEAAAGATLAALTAYQILSRHVKSNDKVLIHAAAGGVGHFAVQIAKLLGAHVTGTTSEKNVDFVKSLGADTVIDYTKQAFEDVIANQDFVLDALSGDPLKRSIAVVKKGGTIISLPSGGIDDEILKSAKEKEVHVAFEIVQSNGNDMTQIAHWLENGKLTTHIFQRYPFDRLIEAHRQIETGRTKGKVIVTV